MKIKIRIPYFNSPASIVIKYYSRKIAFATIITIVNVSIRIEQ